MPDRIIRLCYRKSIDAAPQKAWDQYVWEDSRSELRMQSQVFNPGNKYRLYSELVKNVKEAAALPGLVSTAVVGYLRQLNGIMPDITNALGQPAVPFRNYRFEIGESDLAGGELHRVVLSFISEPLLWHDTLNGMLLVSDGNSRDENDGAWLTGLIPMQPFLSIFSLKTEAA